ncbi:MAG: DUF4340 domain-containing protein [Pseudobdellovibrio sp.]
MKLNKTYAFAAITLLIVAAVYLLDFKAEQKKENVKQSLILNQNLDQITYMQIVKPDLKVGLQKSEFGWSLLEPIQDVADNENVEELLKTLSSEKQESVVKQSETPFTDIELREFGLDKPAVIFNLKDNLGHTKKVSVGSVKNFEGNSFIRVDEENKIVITSPVWIARAENELIYYREKKLYRHSIANINKLKIKSIRDEFTLKKVNDKWTDSLHGYELDQNSVREILKKITETNIDEYTFEGEPSTKMVHEKGLDKAPVSLSLFSDDSSWSVEFNLKMEDKAVYALTERPTFLVKVEPAAWEAFGNLNLDSLRDRQSALAFNPNEVQKIYYKHEGRELSFKLKDGQWATEGAEGTLDNEAIKKVLTKAHDLKISEFIDSSVDRDKFEGQNMLILKSNTEKLVLQINWGPGFKQKKAGTEKEYYYARTQLSNTIFALEKNLIDSLGVVPEKKSEKPGVTVE